MLAVVLAVFVRTAAARTAVVEEGSLQAVVEEDSQREVVVGIQEGVEVGILVDAAKFGVEPVVLGLVQAVLVRALGVRPVIARCWGRRG